MVPRHAKLRRNKMKTLKLIGAYTLDYIKRHWREFLTGLIAGAAAGTLTGCGGMTQSDREVSTSVWAIGVPGVAILRDTHVMPDNKGEATHDATQTNVLTVEPKFK